MADSSEIIANCTNSLPGHGPRQSISMQLRQVADGLDGDEFGDVYGAGEYLAAFEREVAEMFGKAAAVFMPSGTMAQQIALRIWCERSRNMTVAMHPTAHPEFAEQLGYQFLHGMRRLPFGGSGPEFMRDRMLVPDDFLSLSEQPGAVLLELPCRPLGGQLQSFDELLAIREWAQGHSIPVHLDGARIWQCRDFYGKSYTQIGELFDSVYVSFYKDLGGLCGCMLLGPDDFIKASRVWQRRCGGNLYTQSPFVASARLAMHRVLPQIDDWVLRAREVASVFTSFPEISVNPDPPQVNFFRLYIRGDHQDLNKRHLAMAEQTRTLLWNHLGPSPVPGIATTELHLWENGMQFDLDALRPALAQLLA